MSIILFLTLFAFTAVLAQATEFHVATKGDDRISGTKASPFRTVQRAAEAALLGKARIPDAAYENPNGSQLRIDTDYFGNKRNEENPFPGPIENPDKSYLKLKVW